MHNIKNNNYGKFCLGYKTQGIGVKPDYRIIDGWSIRTGVVKTQSALESKTNVLRALSQNINQKSKEKLTSILKEVKIDVPCNSLDTAKDILQMFDVKLPNYVNKVDLLKEKIFILCILCV